MKITYDKNECGFRCMVEETRSTEFMGRWSRTLYRGVSFERHPAKGAAKADAIKRLQAVMI